MKIAYILTGMVAWAVAGWFTAGLISGLVLDWETSSPIFNVVGAGLIVGPAIAVAKLCGRRLRKLTQKKLIIYKIAWIIWLHLILV